MDHWPFQQASSVHSSSETMQWCLPHPYKCPDLALRVSLLTFIALCVRPWPINYCNPSLHCVRSAVRAEMASVWFFSDAALFTRGWVKLLKWLEHKEHRDVRAFVQRLRRRPRTLTQTSTPKKWGQDNTIKILYLHYFIFKFNFCIHLHLPCRWQ